MTDSPIDDTEAREQDAPGTHDAKHQAPVHGHTGGVPSHKALSDTPFVLCPPHCGHVHGVLVLGFQHAFIYLRALHWCYKQLLSNLRLHTK